MKRPAKNPTASDRAYTAIRDGIIAGRYQVADRLREEALAEQLAVSRTPIRAALQKLASDGFVEFTPHAGAVVKGWGEADVREMFEIRAHLESMGARLAAGKVARADIEHLTELCEEMEGLYNGGPEALPAISELNKAFHTRILEIAGNRRLCEMAVNLMDVGFLVRSYGAFSAANVQSSQSAHRSLLAALTARDGQWAEAVMRAHILAAANVFHGTDQDPSPASGKQRKI